MLDKTVGYLIAEQSYNRSDVYGLEYLHVETTENHCFLIGENFSVKLDKENLEQFKNLLTDAQERLNHGVRRY